MQPFKHRLKINSKTTQKLKETTHQLKIRSDHTYQKMISRILDEVLPDYEYSSFNQWKTTKMSELM